MFRLLIICIIFLLLYLGFALIHQLDSLFTVSLYDYYIESTFFTFIVIYILSTIIGFMGLKLIFLILDLPSYLKTLFLMRQTHNTNEQLMKAMGAFIMGDKIKTLDFIKRIKSNIKNDNQIFCTLLLAETAEDLDQQTKYFQELEHFKLAAAFAAKRLAQIFYQKDKYKEAENYAIRSFYLNEYDIDTLEILLDCYFNLCEWEKLTFITTKFNRINRQKFESLKNKLANYYTVAAKNLEKQDTKKAIYYLEIALELAPGHYEALKLYLTLQYSIKQTLDIQILKNAFIANPTFEVVELYQQFFPLPPLKVYEDLATLVNPEAHLGLFLAIAAYLDLPGKVQYLTSSSTRISFDPTTAVARIENNQQSRNS